MNKNEYKKIKKSKIKEDEKGVTMLVLAVTIVVLMLLTTIVYDQGGKQIENNKQVALEIELKMVYNAVLQKYTKESITTNSYPGRVLTSDEILEMQTILGVVINEEKYYAIDSQEEAEKLGFTNFTDSYIVNYEEGIVYNITQKQTQDGKYLYIK